MTTEPTTDPTEPFEWQDAVDAAHGALALDSARKYGLITGGPFVNIDRCEDILSRGKALGYEPATDAVERFVSSFSISGGDS